MLLRSLRPGTTVPGRVLDGKNPVRSMLFTPGDRLDMIEKATRSGTDAVIVDLEDAVAVENKPEARSNRR